MTFGLLCISSSVAQSAVITTAVNPANGRTYYLLTQNTWAASEIEAIGLGGHLATVNDAAENSWILSSFGSFGGINRSLWIGLNDAAAEQTFVWASGETSSFVNWAPGEPNNAPGPGLEDYVHIYGPGYSGAVPPLWNDLQDISFANGIPMHGVVEVVPEPSAAGLLILATGIFLRRRR